MTAAAGPRLRILDPGPLLLLQDEGRPGHLDQGVSPAGAADRVSARRANRLLGNEESAVVLESLLGGVVLEAVGASLTLAVTGVLASLAVEEAGSMRPVDVESPVHLPAGARLHLGRPTAGLRPVIAVRGGVEVERMLGSASRDTLAGLGPEPLAVGDELAVGRPPADAAWPTLEHVVVAPPAGPGDEIRLPIVLGPRDDALADGGLEVLLGQRWTVSMRADRVGIQLLPEGDGVPLPLTTAPPLDSEGTVCGAVEVPPDGHPFVLFRDHPVTVGYPVVAVVVGERALSALGQAAPGTGIRFTLG